MENSKSFDMTLHKFGSKNKPGQIILEVLLTDKGSFPAWGVKQ